MRMVLAVLAAAFSTSRGERSCQFQLCAVLWFFIGRATRGLRQLGALALGQGTSVEKCIATGCDPAGFCRVKDWIGPKS
jgi:hypothetical protein